MKITEFANDVNTLWCGELGGSRQGQIPDVHICRLVMYHSMFKFAAWAESPIDSHAIVLT